MRDGQVSSLFAEKNIPRLLDIVAHQYKQNLIFGTYRAGNTSMSPSKLLANIHAICTIVPTKVPHKWSNIRSISIKTTNSVALPVYNKTPEELEQIRILAKEDKHDVVEVKEVEEVSACEGKSKGKNVASTPLAKALKRQHAMKDTKNEDLPIEKSSRKKGKETVDKEKTDEIATSEGMVTSKSSSRKRKDESADREEEMIASIKTPKSSKKKRSEDKEEKASELNMEHNEPKSSTNKRKGSSATTSKDEASQEKDTEPKSAKKSKSLSIVPPSTNDDVNFIASKLFVGAKKGFVFKKSKLGIGYYRDVLPVVDKVWLSKLGKSGGGAGGRDGGRKSMGHPMQRKKGGGKSRKSY